MPETIKYRNQLAPSDYARLLLSEANKVGDCLECHYQSESNGYACLRNGWKAHRYVYNFLCGEIPEGKYVLHKCDNRRCINPDHLFLGTQQDNVSDMVRKGRHKAERPRLISPEQEIEMFKLREEGWSYGRLATKYMVTKQTIYKYCTGQRGTNASI